MINKLDSIAFPKLGEEHTKTLCGLGKLMNFQPGEFLFKAGDTDFPFYVIKSGEVEILADSREGEKTVVVHTAGGFTGDVDLLTGRPIMVTGKAKTAVEALAITKETLHTILSDRPNLGEILLKAFLMRRQLLEQSGFSSVRVIGSQYSRDTHRIREFLTKNKVPFSWMNLEKDPVVHAFLAEMKIKPEDTPVVICQGGTFNKNPSNSQLAECLGIKKLVDHKVYDLVIVGAGPAGLAGAVYGASEGLKTLLLDSIGPGGQAGTSSKIENYVGFPTGLTGADLANRALIQAEKFGATISAPAQVSHLSSENGYHTLRLESGEEVIAKCVLISAGIAYRRLDVPGCERFEGAGIYYAATAVEAELCQGSQVVIVGSGNSAGQAAVFLSERASRVFLLTRHDLRKTMSEYLVRRIEQTPNVEVVMNGQIKNFFGTESLSAVEMASSAEKSPQQVPCAAVFVFIGATPCTSWLADAVQMDEAGFVKTGFQVEASESWPLRRAPYLLETSRPGIFAAGDVRCGSTKRVASAVGEGSMAIQFVHQYLAAG